MKKLLRPKILIPVIISLGLLAGLLAFGNIPRTVGLMADFNKVDLLWFVLLMGLYELVRGYQWHFLLKQLRIHVPLKGQVFAFLIGEITKNMPIGNYFQNYILQEVGDEDFGRTSSVTTLVVLNEVAVSAVGVVLIGLGGWNSWLRPVIVIGVLVAAILAWAAWAIYERTGPPKWVQERKDTNLVIRELINFKEGARELIHPRILATTFTLTSTYCLIEGLALYVAARGIGLDNIGYLPIVSVYLFGLGFSLIFPTPVDIGFTEISMFGAFLAVGVSKAPATGATFVFRALNILSAAFIAGVSLVFLHNEFRLVMNRRAEEKARKLKTEPEPAANGSSDS